MELQPIMHGLADDLRRAGALGGSETERIADLLVSSSEASIRLRLLEALEGAAREIERSASGVIVDIRLEDRDPVLSLVETHAAEGDDGDDEDASSYADDELVRLTIRLPQGLKARIEQGAAAAGASINSFIVSSLVRALETPSGGSRQQPGRRMPRRMTGFIQT